MPPFFRFSFDTSFLYFFCSFHTFFFFHLFILSLSFSYSFPLLRSFLLSLVPFMILSSFISFVHSILFLSLSCILSFVPSLILSSFFSFILHSFILSFVPNSLVKSDTLQEIRSICNQPCDRCVCFYPQVCGQVVGSGVPVYTPVETSVIALTPAAR